MSEVSKKYIKIRGAREHNLKNVDLDIPRDQLVVLTGLSGSGKSSSNVDRRSHQQNRKTAIYVDEIKQVFKNVTRRGKLIITKK